MAEAGDNGFGVEDGASPVGMRVRVAEESIDGLGAESIITAGDDFIQVYEANVLLLGHFPCPAAVGGRVAADVAINPYFPRNK